MKFRLSGNDLRAMCGIVLTVLAVGMAIRFLFTEQYMFTVAMTITAKLMFKLIFSDKDFWDSFVYYAPVVGVIGVIGTFTHSNTFDAQVQRTKFVNVGKLATMDDTADECFAKLSEDDENNFRTLHDAGFKKCFSEVATNPLKMVVEVSKAYYLDPVSGLVNSAYNEVIKAPEKADCAGIIASLNTLCPGYLPEIKSDSNSGN